MTLKEVAALAPILVIQNCLSTACHQASQFAEAFPEWKSLIWEFFYSNWGFYPDEDDPREVRVK